MKKGTRCWPTIVNFSKHHAVLFQLVVREINGNGELTFWNVFVLTWIYVWWLLHRVWFVDVHVFSSNTAALIWFIPNMLKSNALKLQNFQLFWDLLRCSAGNDFSSNAAALFWFIQNMSFDSFKIWCRNPDAFNLRNFQLRGAPPSHSQLS